MSKSWTIVFEELEKATDGTEIELVHTRNEVSEMLDISELARYAEALKEPEVSTFSIS